MDVWQSHRCAFPAMELRDTPSASPICEIDKPSDQSFFSPSKRSSVQTFGFSVITSSFSQICLSPHRPYSGLAPNSIIDQFLLQRTNKFANQFHLIIKHMSPVMHLTQQLWRLSHFVSAGTIIMSAITVSSFKLFNGNGNGSSSFRPRLVLLIIMSASLPSQSARATAVAFKTNFPAK